MFLVSNPSRAERLRASFRFIKGKAPREPDMPDVKRPGLNANPGLFIEW
jgi:hypothetical protein